MNFIKRNFRDILFYVLLLLNLSILFGTKYVPTLDGGAHCYNAKIVRSLLTESNSIYDSFFKINPEAVPNWTTGALLSFFTSFLSHATAEKTILALFFIGLPFLFKLIVDFISNQKSYFVLLILPFTHFNLIYFGFFNFSFGILFCLLGIYYWNKNFDKLHFKQILVFFIICLLAYFSHLFSLITLVLFCGVKELHEGIVNAFIKENKIKITIQLKTGLIRIGKLLVCTAFPIVLSYLYFKKRPSEGLESFLDTGALNNILLEANIFKSFSVLEDYTAKTFFYLFCFLTLYSLVARVIEAINKQSRNNFLKAHDVFLFCALVMLYLFYTQPDQDGYGAFISVRLALYTFIFLVLWLACNKYDVIITSTVMIAFICNLYFFTGVKKDSIKWLNNELKKMDDVSAQIKEGSIVVPLNFADYNWLGQHYPNYLGARKNIIVTENFEASTGYFPVLWKNPQFALNLLSVPTSKENCDNFLFNLANYPGGKVDYIFVYGERTDLEFYNLLIDGIKKDFVLTYSYQNVALYQKINR